MHASCIKSLPTPLKYDHRVFFVLFLRACLSISATAALISLSDSNENTAYDKPLNLWICQPGHVLLLDTHAALPTIQNITSTKFKP